jgi:hypothetical protein
MCSYLAIISSHLPSLVECDCFVHCVISSSATRGLVHHMANDCCWICIFKPLVEEIGQIELGIWDEFISMGIMKVEVGWTLWESLFVVWSLWTIKVLCSNGFGHMDINVYGWTQFWWIIFQFQSLMVLQNLFQYICMYLQIIFQRRQVYSLLCTFKLFMEIVCVTTICTTCHHY